MITAQPRFDYQKRVIEFERGKEKAGTFVFYGGGKTYLSLEWLSNLSHAFPAYIAMPKPLLNQWVEEVHKFTDLKVVKVIGDREQRYDKLRKGELYVEDNRRLRTLEANDLGTGTNNSSLPDIYLLNYDAVKNPFVLGHLKGTEIRSLIFDESPRLKNHKSMRSKLWRSVVKAAKVGNRNLLSGKPMTEDLEEIYNQMLVLDDGDTLGTAYYKFKTTYFQPGPVWNPHKWTLLPGAEEQLAAKLSRNCIYIPKTEIMDQLPPKEYRTIPFELTGTTNSSYKSLRRAFAIELEDKSLWETKSVLARNTKLQQLANGFMYVEDNGIEMYNYDKLDWLVENIPSMLSDGTNGGVLLWTNFARIIPTWQNYLIKHGISCFTYIAQQSEFELEATRNRFQKGEIKLLLLSEDFANEGLNLWMANHSVFISLGHEAGYRENAEDRCHRIGSERYKQVSYYDLITKGTVEEDIYASIKFKSNLTNSVLKHIQSGH